MLSRFALSRAACGLAPLLLTTTSLAAPVGDELTEALILSGAQIGDLGLANSFSGLDVNNNGDWVTVVNTDSPNFNNSAMVENGLVLLQEGDQLDNPQGVFLNTFGDLAEAENGTVYFDAALSGSPLNALMSEPGGPLVQEGDLLNGLGIPADLRLTDVSRFANYGGNDFVIDAVFEEINDPGSYLDAIVRLEFDGGQVTPTGVIFEGDLLAGSSGNLRLVSSGNHSLDTNSAGLALYVAGTTPNDLTPVDYSIALESSVLAAEGSPSPLAGRNWTDLSFSSVAINDSNDVAWEGKISGGSADNDLLVKNGVKVAQRGDAVPGLPGPSLLGFDNLPLFLSDAGELLWCGVWIGGGLDYGLFIDDKPLVITGVTKIDGATVNELNPLFTGYAMSDNGRYVIFGADLDDGRSGIFRLDRWGNTEAIASCNGNPVDLTAPNGGPQIGEDFTLRFETTDTALALAFIGLSPDVFSPCGTDLPGIGEVLINFTLGLTLLPAGTLNGGPLDAQFPIPADPALYGAQTYAQGLLGDLSGTAPQALLLSDALRLCIGG